MSASSPERSAGRFRFLFVVPPLVGHVNPVIPIAQELADRGHTTAWAGHEDPVAGLLPSSETFLPVADAMPADVLELVESRRLYGPRGFMMIWRDAYLPVNRQVIPGIQAAIDSFEPDVVVVDKELFAGGAVAELRGLPWVTSASNSAELVDWMVNDQLRDWHARLMRDFLLDVGMDEDQAGGFDTRMSSRLVLYYTTRELVGADQDLPEHYAFVGPSLGRRPDADTPFPWEWLGDGDRPCVLVSLGTVNWRHGERFFRVAADAFAEMDARAVFAVSPDAPDAATSVPNAPPNVLVVPRVPQLALLPYMDAVVCHGGHNTVCEALACGLPLVVSPIGDDQPLNADQVARAGAGLRVKHLRLTPTMLREAVQQVLTEPSFREAAQRLRDSFKAAGGAATAADRLETVAGTSSTT